MALVAAFLVSMILAGFWRATHSASGTDDSADPWSGAVGLTRFSAGHRPVVADVVGTTLNGDRLALAEMRGKVVVVNVWGSWCVPCRAEAADLATVFSETRALGVRFVGIDVRDSPAAARSFERRYRISYRSWDDQDAKLLAHFSGIIPISAVPSTMVLDQQGAVAARIVGRVRADSLRAVIADLTRPDRTNARTRATR